MWFTLVWHPDFKSIVGKTESSTNLTDQEFDVLDELYFVVHFKELYEKMGWDKQELMQTLIKLIHKDWVKCMDSPDGLSYTGDLNMLQDLDQMFFLATKKGLLKHNSV